MTNAEKFLELFRGNPAAHYEWRGGKQYVVVDGPLTLADIEAHLRGEMPAMLSIPTLPAGEDGVFRCHFYAGDADRHRPEDLPVDFVAVAKRITDLQLPLVLVHSKSAKSAHVLGFFKDPEGWPCGQARHLIHEFMKLLEIGGELEFFPKQVVLKDGQTGSGLNLCYFGSERWALDKQGERLDLAGFLKLAEERAAYGDVLVGRYLKAGTSAGRALGPSDDDGKPMPVAAIRRIHQKHLDELSAASGAIGGHWEIKLNTCGYYAGRAFAAGALEGTADDIQNAVRTAAAPWENEKEFADDKITRAWADGIEKPLQILDPAKEHDEALKRIEAWLASADAPNPKHEDAYNDLSQVSEEEYARFRKDASKRLKIPHASLDSFVRKRRAASKHLAATTVPSGLTADQVAKALSDLLLTTETERNALRLPAAMEKAAQVAENGLWQYITENADIFCSESGQGYLLFHTQKEMPIPVTRDGKELNAFLSSLGIHSGAAARNRLGKHLGSMCWQHGVRVEPRITFHFDPVTFTGYFAEQPGKLIKITASSIERVDNGADGQLFLLPEKFEPWTLDLENLPAPTDIGPDAFARLPELLFDILDFENESLCREDIEVLLGAYICTLYLPGIVAGKLLLEILGSTGSGKTLFLRMLGRLIYGRQFEVTGLDAKPEQLENAICNNSFLVLDDVKMTTDVQVLGMIRRACTGGRVNRRELYSTFGQVSEPYRAAVALTCSEEPFTGSDEMSNRGLVIRVKGREEYVDENELLQRIDANRNVLMAEMMIRLQSCIRAVKAQANFRPRVKMRMASFATFLLRVGRQFDWGVSAGLVLEAWQEEQEGAGLDDSIVETLGLWFQEPREKWANKKFTAAELYKELMRVRLNYGLPRPWW